MLLLELLTQFPTSKIIFIVMKNKYASAKLNYLIYCRSITILKFKVLFYFLEAVYIWSRQHKCYHVQSAVKSQEAVHVTANFPSKQLLPFCFAEQKYQVACCPLIHLYSPAMMRSGFLFLSRESVNPDPLQIPLCRSEWLPSLWGTESQSKWASWAATVWRLAW